MHMRESILLPHCVFVLVLGNIWCVKFIWCQNIFKNIFQFLILYYWTQNCTSKYLFTPVYLLSPSYPKQLCEQTWHGFTKHVNKIWQITFAIRIFNYFSSFSLFYDVAESMLCVEWLNYIIKTPNDNVPSAAIIQIYTNQVRKLLLNLQITLYNYNMIFTHSTILFNSSV